MAKKKRTITDHCAALYEDTEVADAVLADIKEKGTESKILSGELVLPNESAARHWLNVKLGRVNETEETRAARERIEALEATVNELNEKYKAPDVKYMQELESRLAQLENKR